MPIKWYFAIRQSAVTKLAHNMAKIPTLFKLNQKRVIIAPLLKNFDFLKGSFTEKYSNGIIKN